MFTMEFESDFIEASTPALPYDKINRFSKNEDSGYHTSFTPGSFQYSDVSNDSTNSHVMQSKYCQIQVDCYNITPDVKLRLAQRYNKSSNSVNSIENRDSPASRRGIKRCFQENIESVDGITSIPTPSTVIAGCLRKLKFSDGSKVSKTPVSNRYTNNILHEYNYQFELGRSELSYPTTPVKKVCRSSCKLRNSLSLKKPVKKLITHSLSCDRELLEPVKQKPASEINKCYHIKPNKKIDIIKMLYEQAAMPPIMEIFKHLSNEDIFNFSLVSDVWLNVWDEVSKNLPVKQNFFKFMKNEKENQENKGATPKDHVHCQVRIPMGVHNMSQCQTGKNTVNSPPGSPRTNKFKKFTKAASLDSRLQVVCSRCDQPAKVNKEESEEEWVECTNNTCAYQFCRFCRSDRHPGKKCFQYDLEGPSPTKRRKNSYAMCTKKSKRTLRRLL